MEPATTPIDDSHPTPIVATDAELASVKYNADGLVAAIVQEVGTNEVLMLGWMNDVALRRTLDTGRTWFWSRSRQEYWCKGETSGDRQWVREARYDCDVDVLLFRRGAGGSGRVPHRGAQLLLPCLRQRRHSRTRLTADDRHPAIARRVRRARP